MLTIKKLKKLYAGKKVFITGHTGFKGSWLAFLLHEVGADVTGFALPAKSGPNHFQLLGLEKQITHITGDIRDAKAVAVALGTCQPEFVFHLAAQALVRPSYEDPASTFSTNVQGSVNLLEAVRRTESVRSLIYVTSDKCYENLEWEWGYRENDRLGGRDPYSASKAAAELVFSSYVRSFFEQNLKIGAASVRAGNVIGGGDWAADRIIPDCVRAIQKGEPVLLRNQNATRPWQHVLEPIAGYLLLAERLYENPKKWQGAWNFGPSTNEVRTVRNVAEIIVAHIGNGYVEAELSENRVHEAALLQLNCDKAHQLLEWFPRWDVETTLKATALWYKDFIKGDNVKTITKNQIADFFAGDHD